MAKLTESQIRVCVHNSIVRPLPLDYVPVVLNGCKLSPDTRNNILSFLEHLQLIGDHPTESANPWLKQHWNDFAIAAQRDPQLQPRWRHGWRHLLDSRPCSDFVTRSCMNTLIGHVLNNTCTTTSI
eukprot:2111335-Heterocapsa_arctica.AAC.1